MPRTVTLHAHLTSEELQQHYKTADTPADARRYHALWLISQGYTATAAATVVGLSDKWVRALVQRYNQAGPAGLRDRRADNPGKPPLLATEQQHALRDALHSPPAEGGLWTGQKVAAWIHRHTDIATHPQRGWEYLQRLGFTAQTPRPRHTQAASEEAQSSWKKTCSSE
jgi:transposase